jgi:hypothetical protein
MQHDTPPVKVASTDGLGVAAEARSTPNNAFFPADMLAKATIEPWEEAMAEKGICPKCSDSLKRASEFDGMRFLHCMGCGDVFVVSA